MKKLNKINMGILIAAVLINIISILVYAVNKTNKEYHLMVFSGTFFLAGLLMILFPFIYEGIAGYHNFQNCDDSEFDVIDKMIFFSSHTNKGCLDVITLMNRQYSDNGIVAQMVKNREVKRLYTRKDFLKNRINLFPGASRIILSVLTAILTKVLMDYLNWGYPSGVFASMIAVALFTFIVLGRYCERGVFGSFYHELYQYELTLLEDKIFDLKKNMEPNQYADKVSYLKITAIQVSHKKLKFPRKRDDVCTIKELELALSPLDTYQWKNCLIGKQKASIPYKKNTKTGTLELPNENYQVLIEILEKHNLITIFEEESDTN